MCKKDNKVKMDDNSNPAVTAKVVLEKTQKALDKMETKAEGVVSQIFQRYVNLLLPDESRQLWDKIVKVQMKTAP